MWHLTYNGGTKSFADWGLSNLRRSRVSQAQDTVSFTAPGRYDADELFPFGSVITISYQAVVGGVAVLWFYGRVIQVPRSGSGAEENMDYVLAGPWWYLDNLVYQQGWQQWKTHPYTLIPPEIKLREETVGTPPDEQVYDIILHFSSRVILGQDTEGAKMTSGQVIADVIAYAIASGAPIASGTIEPDVDIPFDAQNDITCAEAIRRVLRWSPDAVAWFDYSTSPYPTFHCARRAVLTALSVPFLDNPPAAVAVTPRPDLQAPAVILKFEQTNTVGDSDFMTTVTDKYPLSATSREFGALIATLELAGSDAQYVSQRIVVEDLYSPGLTSNLYADEGFWRAHDPSITDEDIYELSFVSGSEDPLYDQELVEGQVQDWMTGVHAVEYTVTAVALVTIHDSEGEIIKEEFRTLSCRIIATDAKTKTYTKLASLITGEAIPVGLAKALYDSLHPLQYEGAITLAEEECGLSLTALRAAIGYVLNPTGGLVAWEAMRAQIQKVEENVDSGITTINFGPTEQLSPQDLVERLRANRGRGVAYDFLRRTSGESADSNTTVALSGLTPARNNTAAGGQTKLLVVKKSDKKITLDPDTLSAANKYKVLTISDEDTAQFDWVRAHA